MRAFRIADRRFPIFDGTGARLIGGRWNSPGRSVIYAAETYAGALLEVLVHSNLGRVPKTHAVIEISIPDPIAVESLDGLSLPGWDAEDQIASRAFGDEWLDTRRSPVLFVPSAILRGREHNALTNPEHPDFPRIRVSAPQDVQWDKRLFVR
ncbi:MAG: RES domain-containing protein [Bryobacteraceae bacterium]